MKNRERNCNSLPSVLKMWKPCLTKYPVKPMTRLWIKSQRKQCGLPEKMTFVLRKILRDGFRVRNVRHHEKKGYAINRLDGLIKKIEYAMEKAVVRVVRQLKQPEKKKAVVEEIKKEVKPSIREKLALNVAKIQREEAERKH